MSCDRLSAGTAGAGVSAETGRRVRVTERIADRAAQRLSNPALFGFSLVTVMISERSILIGLCVECVGQDGRTIQVLWGG